MDFRLYPLRFSFAARDSIHFPAGKAGNILRGAFGTTLRSLVCAPECPGARECPVRATCAYARMFEPRAVACGPSGLADWPRPFVFRATHLDGVTLGAGAGFHFDFHLFDMRAPAIDAISGAFAELSRTGLGPRRGRADLSGVSQWYGSKWTGGRAEPFTLDLAPGPQTERRIRVRFATPTELKADGRERTQPEFGTLMARIRDRIGALRELYGDGPLDIDFRAFGERAARVRMTHCEIARVETERRSSRTGQTHPIGGFVGEAEYEGDLSEFIPYLKAAQWTGVGRQTVWGKGEIHVL